MIHGNAALAHHLLQVAVRERYLQYQRTHKRMVIGSQWGHLNGDLFRCTSMIPEE